MSLSARPAVIPSKNTHSPITFAFSQKYLDESFAAFMSTKPAAMPVTPTQPVVVRFLCV